MSIEGIFATDAAAKRSFYYTCDSPRGAANATSATSFCIEMALVTFNYF